MFNVPVCLVSLFLYMYLSIFRFARCILQTVLTDFCPSEAKLKKKYKQTLLRYPFIFAVLKYFHL